MKTKTSVLKAIMEEIYTAPNYDIGMVTLRARLEDADSPIRDGEKRMIMMKAQQCEPSLPKLQQYLTNSWLKFEGMGC